MAVINNLPQYHNTIAAVCPIVGVDADGGIHYADSATPANKAAAQKAAADYTDVTPSLMTIDVAMERMTDDEYQKLIKHADKPANVKMHRTITHAHLFDLALQSTQDAIDALVADHVMTAERAREVFAPLPPPPPLVVAPFPPPHPEPYDGSSEISPVSGS